MIVSLKNPFEGAIRNKVYEFMSLGFAAPFILPAKRLLQQLCKEKIGWDEDVPPSVLEAWERWLNDLPLLRSISVPRYLKSHQLGPLKSIQLHHFSDASFAGYGVVSYLRFEDVDEKVNCALVMAKSRVAPIKPTTIPRLELTAATVAVKQHRQISQELDLKVHLRILDRLHVRAAVHQQ